MLAAGHRELRQNTINSTLLMEKKRRYELSPGKNFNQFLKGFNGKINNNKKALHVYIIKCYVNVRDSIFICVYNEI